MSQAPDLSEYTKEYIKEALDPVRHNVSLAIYHSSNYFNLGSIIRVAHGFLCKEIYAIDCDAFYKKATMGTHKWENVRHVTLDEFLEQTKNRSVVAYERRPDLDTKNLYTFEYPENPILLFGSEKVGIPDICLQNASSVVGIPMYGLVNDMNLANAVSIGAYDWLQKHYGKQWAKSK